MGARRRKPAAGGTARGSLKERSEDRLDYLNTPANIAQQARSVVDQLVANGANFTFRPSESALPASFTYELRSGGDRQRCRQIIAEARGRPLVWAAMLKEIARRAGGAA